jgi:hypothetical protein
LGQTNVSGLPERKPQAMMKPGSWTVGLLLFGLGVAAPLAGVAAQDSCVSCHEALGDERLFTPAASYRDDIHAAKKKKKAPDDAKPAESAPKTKKAA